MRAEIDAQQVGLVAGLQYNPGYLLLLDWIQAQFDSLTDDLGDRGESGEKALAKLQYWRAFRDLLHTLKVQPANFAGSQTEEEKKPEETTVSPNVWLKMQQHSAQYFDDSLAQ